MYRTEMYRAEMYRADSAAAAGYVRCTVCGQVHKQLNPRARCQLCGASLAARQPRSAQRSLAYLLTAIICYLPAMLLPIMYTTQLGSTTGSTIVGGAVTLWQMGSMGIAVVIFVASVMVPILKMLALSWLNLLVIRGRPVRREQAMRVFHITELVGKWSMVDVFVVAVLVALVQIEPLMQIRPGSAALYFAGVVVLTMLSARAFDHRLIWDLEPRQRSGDTAEQFAAQVEHG